MATDLTGRVAVVTGAARGIGRAMALGLARAGCAVAAADLNEAGAEETARLAGDALHIHVDVTQSQSVDALMRAALRRWNRIDILVNDAGVFPRSTVLDMDEQMWDQVVGVNLKGTFLCSRAAARIMVEQG